MTAALLDFVRHELAAPMPDAVRDMAALLAEAFDARAVLFYGSILRTGDLDGVLDFYILTDGPHRRGLRALVEAWLWPEVGYHEQPAGDVLLRAKAAVLPMSTFHRAAGGQGLDTTIWTRFVQPSALAWSADPLATDQAAGAIAAACETAARFAGALGPPRGTAGDFWKALFVRTYAAELRVEKAGREDQIIGHDPARYERLLALAWRSGGVAFDRQGEVVSPSLSARQRRRLAGAWRWRQTFGKALNAARLVKAAFTFDGAARYAAWKIERHTGVAVALTPWREKHPILNAPAVLWRVWRARRP